MATHLCAFYEQVDSATLTAVDTIVDEILSRPAADRFQVPSDLSSIAFALASGPYLTRAQIVSPSIEVRRMTLDIVPARRGARTFGNSYIEALVPKADLVLTPTENFQLFASEDGSGATDIFGLIALKAPGALPAMPGGDIRVLRATAQQTLSAYEWTTFTPTLEHDLEPGTYTLVGFIPISASIVAARAIFTGQGYRPGVPGRPTSGDAHIDFDEKLYDKLMWYPMGSFTHISPPQFQFLAWGADTSETIILFLIKTA
jgi:hypothetical protein